MARTYRGENRTRRTRKAEKELRRLRRQISRANGR